MTQADGNLPTPELIRRQMRTIKPLLTALEDALTAAARVPVGASTQRRFNALAALSVAHASLDAELVAMDVILGLPYEAVIENVSYTAMFGPDD